MKSSIEKEVWRLYNAGNIMEAFEYYATALWHGKEDSMEPFAAWLEDETLVEKAGEKSVCALIAAVLLSIDRCEEAMREHLWTLCQNTLDRITTCEYRDDTTDWYVVSCNLHRHQGNFEKALEVILSGLAKGATTSRYTFAGLTYLDLENEEEAEKYIALGYQSDPANAAAYNDLGDYYFDRRRWQEAERCYYNVLKTNHNNDCDWAEPSWHFCRFMHDGSLYEREQLALCAAVDSDNERALLLCRMAVYELLVPNVDYLEPSSESIMNLVRNVRDNNNTSGITSCATTCQESASSINAMRLAISEIMGKPAHFTVVANRAQDPPLDKPVHADGIVLWNYADLNTPIPAVSQPSEFIGRLVGRLAATEFSLADWYKNAAAYASEIPSEQSDELYGVMVYPPKQTDSTYPPEDWLSRVQFAAVCILARISLHEIDRICKGQLDWPIIPAFTLAAWLASQEDAYRQWAEDLLNLIAGRISSKNYCFFEYAYTCAASLLPGKEEAYYTELWQWRQSLK